VAEGAMRAGSSRLVVGTNPISEGSRKVVTVV
jgi:hypothetical protein